MEKNSLRPQEDPHVLEEGWVRETRVFGGYEAGYQHLEMACRSMFRSTL